MEVIRIEKTIILFFIYSHDKFFALSLLNPLEKNLVVAIPQNESFLLGILESKSLSLKRILFWLLMLLQEVPILHH